MKGKHIAFIELNTTGATINYIKAARQSGYLITLIVTKRIYYNKFPSIEKFINNYVDYVIECDTHYNLENLVKQLKSHVPLDGIIATHDLEVFSASYVAKELGLPFNNLNAVKTCRDKYALRKFLISKNLSTVEFDAGKNLESLLKKAKTIGYPLVFKPINTTDSYSVSLVSSDEELQLAFNKFKSDNNKWRGTLKEEKILLEKFQQGDLISIESISNGKNVSILGVTGRQLGPEPYFVEEETLFPLELNYELSKAIKLVKDALKELSYNLGPAHTEIILTDNGPEIIEINPRLVGGPISGMINTVLEEDIYNYILSLYTNKNAKDSINIQYHGYGLSKMIMPNKKGVLNELSIPEHFMEDPYVRITKNFDIGDYVHFPAEQNSHSLGEITVIGENSTRVNRKMKNIFKNLTITIQ